MQSFDIALIQMRVGPSKADNLARAEERIVAAADDGAALVVLPEMFTCPIEIDRFAAFAEPLPGGPAADMLSRVAARCRIHLVGGSIPERHGDRVYNTATLWSPSGELLLTHRKVHLFDVDIPGGIRFRESEALTAGDTITTATTELGCFGLAVCYDLRFPEVFRSLALAGAQLVLVPGAFNTTTGPAHWRTLIRARAIENTCFVAACSPVPHPEGSYPAWGHSLVVDPYGEVLAAAEREEVTLRANVSGARLAEVRRAVPVLSQRRPEVYRRAGL